VKLSQTRATIGRMRIFLLILLAMTLPIAGCQRDAAEAQTAAIADTPPPPAPTVRFATYNVSFYADAAGGLIQRLENDDERARRIATVIQHLRPDVLLLNEFDYDAEGRAADLFQSRYLDVPQAGQTPIRYEHRYFAPVNTGEPSGLDLNGDGEVGGPDDAWGFGRYPGQYGMLVLSRFPIDAANARTFQHLRWKNLPNASRPMNPDGTPFHPDATWEQLRLSSKSHWDLPIATPLGEVHFLVSHPTPPVFDGDENRNGLRNSDEIRLWLEYLDGEGDKSWLCDDRGRCGALAAQAQFVIAGDQNADANDGDGDHATIAALLAHPRVDSSFVPRADGGAARAAEYALPRSGDTHWHTGDFGPKAGTLRLDYVLPSRGLAVIDGGIFWPVSPQQHVPWADASDHHLVWLDLARAPSN
jgi:endonuclease/exonuclease/phosphatase family metal-dependent hydrolase